VVLSPTPRQGQLRRLSLLTYSVQGSLALSLTVHTVHSG
jgi:hypothetical protein